MVRRFLLGVDHRAALVAAGLARRLGFRGAFLGAIATLDLIWAWSLVDPHGAATLERVPTYQWIARAGAYLTPGRPLLAWAVLLGAIGILAGVQAWMADDRLAYAAAISVKIMWAALTAATWPAAHVQALRVAALWLVLAWIVSVCAAGLPYQRRA